MTSVPIVAVGVCAPLGRDLDTLWKRIAAGDDGFREVTRFALPGLPTRWACAFDGPTVDQLRAESGQPDAALAYAVLAARDALASLSQAQRDDTHLVVATSAGAADAHDAYDLVRGTDEVTPAHLSGGAFTSFASTLAAAVGVGGPTTTVSTACASGGHALGLAIDLVRTGEASRVLVVGSDTLHPSLFAGFSSVGALAPEPCGPFGPITGMSLGEGAGALLLSREAEDPLGHLVGWGASCDAFHATAPDPRGAGMARGLRAALADAGLAEVDAFNAHGTGTEANDPAETFAITAVLPHDVPVSASKSQLGHTQGAAGVLEALVTLGSLRAQVLAPSLRSTPHRRHAPADTVSGGARPAQLRTAMSHSAAFGGTNVAVVLGTSPRSTPTASPGPISAIGLGGVGPFDPSTMRYRRADPVTALLSEAIERAMNDADWPRGRALDDVALVTGMADGPEASIRRFVDSRDERGLARASAAAFARMVFNAPAGAAATTHQVRGPNVTLWVGHGAGLHAVVCGARMLRANPALAAVVAAGADEDGYLTRERHQLGLLTGPPVAAAGAVILGRGPGVAVLEAWSCRSAPRWRQAVEQVTTAGRADLAIVSGVPGASLGDVPVQVVEERFGCAPAAAGPLACQQAIHALARGDAQRVLVVSVSAEGGAVALLWCRPEPSP